MSERKNNSLLQLLDLLIQAADIAVAKNEVISRRGILIRWLLIQEHGLDTRVVLIRKQFVNDMSILIDTKKSARNKLCLIDETRVGEEVLLIGWIGVSGDIHVCQRS